jgi:hypothetical protein
MKYLLIALACVAGPALSCPADGSKDAARSTDTTMAASTAKPAAQTQARTAKKATPAKVAVRSAAMAPKTAPL